MKAKELFEILTEYPDLNIDLEDYDGNTLVSFNLKDFDLADVDNTIRLQHIEKKEPDIIL